MNILNEAFIQSYASRHPMNMLGETTYWRTYSRNIWEENRKEEWHETVGRVVNGVFATLKLRCAIQNSKWDQTRAERTAKDMFIAILFFKFTPPGRGLYAMGSVAVEAHGGAVLNNCAFLSTRNPEPSMFSKLMTLTMLGVGVGYDTLGAGRARIHRPSTTSEVRLKISDDRQGWTDSVHDLLESYMVPCRPACPNVVFDYSDIRPAGMPIKRFGGVSSGPAPLKRLHESLRALCEEYVGKAVDSAFLVDTCNFIGRCVVAGNVRRSAQIALGLPDDQQFLHLKTDMSKVMTHRAFSNNSILAHVGMDYGQAAELTEKYGEPGYFWLDNARMYGRMNGTVSGRTDFLAMGTNPCSEQTLEDGELCCLVETYPSHHMSLSEYLNTLKLAYLYAKSVTLIPTGFDDTDAIIARNRRIGCSMSGVIPAIEKFGAGEFMRWCNRGYDFLTGLDASYSSWLKVPESIKRTSIKPSGTVSLLANVSPGIHYPHAEFYTRRVRFQSDSAVLPALEASGYRVLPDVYGQEGATNTMVVEFPIYEPHYRKGKPDATMWEQMALAAMMQKNWSDNQVSITVHFRPEEAKDIPMALEIYQHQLKSVSFLPYDPHDTYPLAPYEATDAARYAEQMERVKPMKLPYDVVDVNQESVKGCDSDSCLTK